MNKVYQLAFNFKFDNRHDLLDIELFMKKVFSKVTDMAEEEGIEVTNDRQYKDLKTD